MAIIFIDGFDHYTTTTSTSANSVMSTPYSFPGGTNAKLNTATLTSGMALAAGTGGGRPVDFILPSTYNSGTLGFGCHVYYDANNSDDRGAGFLASTTVRFAWRIDGADGTLYLQQPISGTAVNCGVLAENTLYFIELKAVMAGSSGGSVSLQVNGVTKGTITGITTNNLGIDRLTLGYPYAGSTGWQINFDNLFIWDGTGSINNDWIGERNVVTLYPNADTAQADWALSTGSDGYDLVDDVPPNDTTFLSSATVDDESQFGLQNLTNTGVNITAVQATARADKADTGDASLKVGIIETGGMTDYPASGTVLIQDQFKYVFHVSETNPATSVAWTSADLAAALIGIKRA